MFYLIKKSLLGSGDYSANKKRIPTLKEAKNELQKIKSEYLKRHKDYINVTLDNELFVKLEMADTERNSQDVSTKIWISETKKGTPLLNSQQLTAKEN